MSGIAIPDRWSPRFAAFFGWYAGRQLARRFHAVRLAQGSEAALAALREAPGPALVAMSHASWWDPMVAVWLHRRHFPDRGNVTPMDSRELARFRFLTRLGIFGIDPDDPASLPAMVRHVEARLATMSRGTFVVTPQGRFTDVRDPVTLRPGAASVLAAVRGMQAWCVAVEYAFWVDARPEVFIRVERVPEPAQTRRAAWQGALQGAMQQNADALSMAVRARKAERFTTALGGEARVHPVYDLWLRVRGRSRAIDVEHRRPG